MCTHNKSAKPEVPYGWGPGPLKGPGAHCIKLLPENNRVKSENSGAYCIN